MAGETVSGAGLTVVAGGALPAACLAGSLRACAEGCGTGSASTMCEVAVAADGLTVVGGAAVSTAGVAIIACAGAVATVAAGAGFTVAAGAAGPTADAAAVSEAGVAGATAASR